MVDGGAEAGRWMAAAETVQAWEDKLQHGAVLPTTEPPRPYSAGDAEQGSASMAEPAPPRPKTE